MCNPKFLEEVFRPQDAFSNTSMRGIFNRLAHSSIMRLSVASMDKLYDLMTMGVKYQSVTLSYPAELLTITMNHINYLKALTEKNTSVRLMVEDAENRIQKMYGSLTMAQFQGLRTAIALFFQDRRVKVSLFLQDGIQHNDGELALTPGGWIPPYSHLPGTVRIFAGADVRERHEEIAGLPTPPPIAAPAGPRTSPLGANLYAKERAPRKPVDKSADKTDGTAGVTATSKPAGGPAAQAVPKQAAAEIDSFASLLGGDDASGFKITLTFGSDTQPSGTTPTKSAGDSGPKVAVEVFDQSQQGKGGIMDKSLAAIMASLSTDDDDAASAKAGPATGSGDDLLDMMDNL
eukprot:TRINITY_DN7728_c0_g2_i1.p1 TRINITY_DN7728_c0_g2~~TRINITY_DN7728_c0_g2_i1.p1  ORF type:complete len:347 (-),score=79.16 TRINITY_DN7728_c0_g2_i1:19-1059(-)